ncbi:MAG: hypothetical protein VB855_18175 [Pirellulaceae bacterium]
MIVENHLVRWTVRIAMLLYVAALAGEIQATRKGEREATIRRWQRICWTLGCLVFLVHVATAFHFQHGWSHRLATEHTAEVAEQVVGWAFGEGIYFNYAFTLLWSLDVAWMWLGPVRREQRARWMTVVLHVFMLTIVVNGAIIFATGPTRWVGLLVLGVLGIFWVSAARHRRQVWQPESP